MALKDRIEWSKHHSELSRKCRFKGCVFPDHSNCSKKIVKAHSVQKNKILINISDNGIVTTIDFRRSIITNKFENVGIGEASTFFGFCNHHDTLIFSKIENEDYKGTLEQNFLHAYRACAREYVIKKQALCILQNSIERAAREEPSFLPFVGSRYTAYQQDLRDIIRDLNKFHVELHKSTLDRNDNLIKTRVYEFPFESLLAVNSAFPITHDFEGNVVNDLYNYERKMIHVYLNVFPQNNTTYILLSCLSEECNTFKDIFSKLDEFSNPNLEQVFSQIILVHCENFFLSPKKWKRLPDEKKRLVWNFYKETISPPGPDYLLKNPPINLFEIMKS